MSFGRTFLATTCALIMLGTLASTATAGRLSVSEQLFTATYSTWEIGGPFGTFRCALTLEGSLHSRSIAKVANTLIGNITFARLGTCSNGSATVLTETLPWHTTYVSFGGTLPSIERITTNVIGFAFRIREGASNCLWRSTAGEPARVIYGITGGTLSSAELGGSIRSGAECLGVRGTLRGRSNSITAAGVTLI